MELLDRYTITKKYNKLYSQKFNSQYVDNINTYCKKKQEILIRRQNNLIWDIMDLFIKYYKLDLKHSYNSKDIYIAIFKMLLEKFESDNNVKLEINRVINCIDKEKVIQFVN